jgi:protocatechuate 3,4-dioxygenase beta subunit
MKWWKQAGSERWPHMHILACIMLPKSFHNRFQERVFSRGTYKDDTLKKRVKDENFEMKVLDNLNASKCDELLQDIHLQGRNENDVRYVKNFFAAGEAAVVPPLCNSQAKEKMMP